MILLDFWTRMVLDSDQKLNCLFTRRHRSIFLFLFLFCGSLALLTADGSGSFSA